MNTNSKIKLLYSPIYELLLSFLLYKRPAYINYLDVGRNWTEKAAKLLSPNLKSRIEAIDNVSFFEQSIILIKQCPKRESMDEFFSWLKSLKAGEIYERLAPYVNQSLSVNLEEQRDEYIDILKEWYHQYFNKELEEYFTLLQQDLKRVEGILSNTISSEDIIEEVTNGFVIDLDEINDIYLIPSYHFRPMSTVEIFQKQAYIWYPIKVEADIMDDIIIKAKALTDKRRLQILSFLSTGIYSFMEIVNYMNKAKGNIHHHVLTLRAAGVISIHIKDNNASNYTYSFRKKFSKEFIAKIDRYTQL